jgi:hypothetical protein
MTMRPRDLAANEFWIEVFTASDESHFLGDNALSGGFQLRHRNTPYEWSP